MYFLRTLQILAQVELHESLIFTALVHAPQSFMLVV